MRTTEERVSAVMERVTALREEKKMRRTRILFGCCAAAGMALLLGFAAYMPALSAGQAAQMQPSEAASVFASGTAGGYILVAVLAFTFGAAVSLLCIRLRKKDRS